MELSGRTHMTPRWTVLAILFAALALLACDLGSTLPVAIAPTPQPSLVPSTAVQPSIAPNALTASLCTDTPPLLVTDLQVRQTPSLAEPNAHVPFRDPVFGTCLVRVTDRATDLAPDDDSAGLKNEYSRVQSFNADESRLLARGIQASWYLYDAQTLQPLGRLGFDGSVDPRWDANNPNLLYFIDGTQLLSYNTQSNERKLVHDFAIDFPDQSLSYVWTRYEGSPSNNGQYWGLMAQDQNDQLVAFIVYDQSVDRLIATRDLRGFRGEIPDTVTISPLGNYFVAQFEYCEPGTLGSDAQPCGLMVYDRGLKNGRGLLRIIGHSDLAFDAQGREVMIYQDIDNDTVALIDLATGAVTPLFPIDFSGAGHGFHFSGRAFRQPGWAVVSTYNGGHPTHVSWMDDAVMAVELKKGGRIVRLAHTHSVYDERQEKDYWAEPHASANRDLTRIIFTSNWERSGTEQVEMFMIELPTDWSARLP